MLRHQSVQQRSRHCSDRLQSGTVRRQADSHALWRYKRNILCTWLEHAYLCGFRLGVLLWRQLQQVFFLTLLFHLRRLPILVLLLFPCPAKPRRCMVSKSSHTKGGCGEGRPDESNPIMLDGCSFTYRSSPHTARHHCQNHAAPESTRRKTLNGWRGRGGVAWPTSHRTSARCILALVGATRCAPVERVDVLKFECESSHASYAT